MTVVPSNRLDAGGGVTASVTTASMTTLSEVFAMIEELAAVMVPRPAAACDAVNRPRPSISPRTTLSTDHATSWVTSARVPSANRPIAVYSTVWNGGDSEVSVTDASGGERSIATRSPIGLTGTSILSVQPI